MNASRGYFDKLSTSASAGSARPPDSRAGTSREIVLPEAGTGMIAACHANGVAGGAYSEVIQGKVTVVYTCSDYKAN